MTTAAASCLVLSLFPGAGLLDRGFELSGYTVVRGPDTLFGQDIRPFTLVNHAGKFAGIVGGPPCQDFSRARRRPPTGHGREMLSHFRRLVTEAQPEWWLMENVPTVPDMVIPGYTTQRFNLFASEFGLRQKRNRSFQFGSKGEPIAVLRGTESHFRFRPAALASDGEHGRRRTFADFCELQGLPRSFDLPGLSRAAKFRAVGNGVPVPMAFAVAVAIRDRSVTKGLRLCECGCGRAITPRAVTATAACRKRQERKRRAAASHPERHDSFPPVDNSTFQLRHGTCPRLDPSPK
jgi:DNA (cytosine-5)-methyltransferase 1